MAKANPGAGAPPAVTDQGQLRALLDLMMSSEFARTQAVPLHHTPEALTRSPAKLEILLNSLLVFMERGVGPVTVQDLLDAAKISRRTFYKYFRNKIDVLESLYKLAVDIMILRYKGDIDRAQSVEQVAQHMVEVFFGYHQDLGSVIHMMQEEAVRTDSPLAPHRTKAMATLVALVNQELQRVAGRKIDPLTIQAVLWAMESTSIEILRGGGASVSDVDHGKRVLAEITEAAFVSAIRKH